MFGKLKEKLKSWTKKVTEEAPEIEETKKELIEDKVETKPDKKTKEKKTKEEIREKRKETSKKEKKPKKEKLAQESQQEIKEISKKELVEEIKEKPAQVFIEEDKEIGKEPEEEPKKKSFFSKLTSKKTKISEQEFDKYKDDLEMLLLENNVAFEVTEKIIKELKAKITEKEISKKELEKEINDSLKEIIKEILVEPFDIVKEIKEKDSPYVVMFCGINGTGKTTTIAKFANLLKKEKLSCVIAAGDTFRSAAIEQIKTHGENLGVKVISHEYNSDPAAVGFDAIKYAEKNNIDAVLIDTAGRIHTDKNLMNQISKIAKVCKPDAKIFVGESLTGNDSVEQVKTFNEAVELNGIILTKADIDEKGGTALSVGYITEKPILFLGIGQEYDKLEKFDKKKFIERLGLD